MTEIMQSAWLSFMKTGVPSTAEVSFARYDPASPEITVLDSKKTGDGCRVEVADVSPRADEDACYASTVEAVRAAEKFDLDGGSRGEVGIAPGAMA